MVIDSILCRHRETSKEKTMFKVSKKVAVIMCGSTITMFLYIVVVGILTIITGIG